MASRGKALVTGASRGLGRALAMELAMRGYHVIAGVRDIGAAAVLNEQARGLEGVIEVQQIDVANLGRYQPPEDLQILVNNAGYRGPYLPIEEADLNEWHKTFNTNFFGVVDLTRRAIPALRQSGAGVICNIGSLGVYTPLPFYSIYRASKAAVAALSEGLRIELAPFGIRVVEIPIGGVDTDMLRTSIARRPPDAIAYDLYRPMAERQAGMAAGATISAIATEEAARQVVDEMFRDGPLRRACDPNAVTGLAYVESSTEEARMVGMLERFGLAADGSKSNA